MDLFPDGSFVRLRNRARDKYACADEDASGVSLRPLGAVAYHNAVWKVKVWPVEGVNFVLLQGVAYGRYLAVSDEHQHAPGVRGVRAVQLDLNSLNPEEDAFKWTDARVEAGQNYVRLQNTDMRCLRANGRHRYWNNVVTVDVRNHNDETTMMQWRVDAIPSTPEPLSLPPPPHAPCCGCGREGSATLCRRCVGRFKATLPAVAEIIRAAERARTPQRYCYCLDCRKIFTDRHQEHADKTIPLGRYKEQFVAWLTGEEPWRGIFERIETQERAIRPYPLYKSGAPRCKICLDTVSTDHLYGALFTFCSLSCFVSGDGGEEMAVAMLAIDCSNSPIGFCLKCLTTVMSYGGGTHRGHDWLRIRSSAGLRPSHPKKQDWASINKEGLGSDEVLIRDDTSVRCKMCQKRLASAGDTCSLQCSLDSASREPLPLPRSLQLRKSQ